MRGNVFSAVRDVSFRELKVGTGLGLRAETPVGLFRVDYGFPLSRAEGRPGGPLVFLARPGLLAGHKRGPGVRGVPVFVALRVSGGRGWCA